MNKNIVVMKPKISSGYLTPQGNKRKKVMDNLSGNKKTNKAFEIDDEVFKTLMQCPEKKKMILKLLALNKNAIEEYKQKETEDLDSVKKLKKPINCESPTALFRRKALEQMNRFVLKKNICMYFIWIIGQPPVTVTSEFKRISC